jgi:hypothetical protein
MIRLRVRLLRPPPPQVTRSRDASRTARIRSESLIRRCTRSRTCTSCTSSCSSSYVNCELVVLMKRDTGIADLDTKRTVQERPSRRDEAGLDRTGPARAGLVRDVRSRSRSQCAGPG